MPTDGKGLEKLVAAIEERFLPAGLKAELRVRQRGEDGRQIAEFDILVSGRIGTSSFSWLIECRDRPSDGPAPAAWIEQLVGRRSRFLFDKITAVSTTGFASPAIDYAKSVGIDLREVATFEPGTFEWIEMHDIEISQRISTLRGAYFRFDTLDTNVAQAALKRIEVAEKAQEPALRSSATGEMTRCENAFLAAVQAQSDERWPARFEASYTLNVVLDVTYSNDDDHFVVDTDTGPVRILSIQFRGEIAFDRAQIPMIRQDEYRAVGDGVISQVTAFQPVELKGAGKFALEFHRMPSLGYTEVLLRRHETDES